MYVRLRGTKLNYKLIKLGLNESESSFLFLAIFGKVVFLRSVRGKLMTRINEKCGKFSYNLSIFLQKFLFGVGRAMWSVSEGFIPVRVRHINHSVG